MLTGKNENLIAYYEFGEINVPAIVKKGNNWMPISQKK